MRNAATAEKAVNANALLTLKSPTHRGPLVAMQKKFSATSPDAAFS